MVLQGLAELMELLVLQEHQDLTVQMVLQDHQEHQVLQEQVDKTDNLRVFILI
jgi:hypothetical protein